MFCAQNEAIHYVFSSTKFELDCAIKQDVNLDAIDKHHEIIIQLKFVSFSSIVIS